MPNPPRPTAPAQPPAHPAPQPALLLQAAARLLRPLVRLMIRGGVTFPTLAEMLRALYVDIARNDLLTDPKSRTDSRISLMTGVHRKELRRHRAPDAGGPAPLPVTVGSQVAARWMGRKELADEAGRPRPLPRTAPPGTDSFESLVASVTKDVRPRAVLDDWLDAGLVALAEDGTVHLRAEAFLPRGGSGAQMFYFGRNLHDHLEAATANTLSANAPFLDRSVHYDGLSAQAAAALTALAREAAQRMLLDVNREALALAEADDLSGLPDRHHRVNLGAYLFTAAEPAPETPEQAG